MLEGASKPEFLNLIGSLSRDILFEHLDCSSGLVEQPTDTVERGGLTTAIGSDEAYEFTWTNLKGDVLNRRTPCVDLRLGALSSFSFTSDATGWSARDFRQQTLRIVLQREHYHQANQ